MRTLKWILLALGIVLLLGAIGFTIWAYTPLGPMPEALAALETDSEVAVKTEPWLVFAPQVDGVESGFIFYPGGRVDPRSYAPAARALAAEGHLVAIVPMPFNLAVFNPDAAAEVIAAYPQIARWTIGGHSLGGSMAANFAWTEPGAVDGLVLWAAYPAGADDLSGSEALAAASVYATNDGLATLADIEASRPLMPAATAWTAIEGGNHAQFGWYGPQPGDGEATISREAQQEQVVAATLAVLGAGD